MNMNAAELDEVADDVFQGVFEYNDIMEFTPADASVQPDYDWSAVPNELLAVPNELLAAPNELLAIPNELLAVPNQGQNPFGQTAGRPISSPPSVERPNGGADAGSANAEHNLPEVPTARKRRANGIAFHDSFTHERDWELSSDGSGIEVVLVAHVERPDANTAQSARRKAKKRQRSTDAGSQTDVRGEGGAPHVPRTASEVPQRCVHSTGGGGLPPVQGRIAQETRETSARGSENAIATGDGDAGAIPRRVGSTGELGSETSAAPGNAGDDNAGAIPKPVASKSNDEQTEGGEEAQAEREIDQKATGHGTFGTVMCVVIAVMFFVGYKLGSNEVQWSNALASLSAFAKPRTINCDVKIEAAAAFCRDKGCVDKVSSYCANKRFVEKKGLYAIRRASMKEEEDEIIAKYM